MRVRVPPSVFFKAMHFGLIGKSLKHSFSKDYFIQKFHFFNLPFHYHLYELQSLEEVVHLLNQPNFKGLNVTIPFKSDILKYADKLSPEVEKIGAANVLAKEGHIWVAYNTDTIGFEKSLLSFIPELKHLNAVVLGNGGASKAITYVLEKLLIPYVIIARNPQTINQFPLNKFSNFAKEYKLWINTTPVGMYPNSHEILNIDFSLSSSEHYLYDLIYNPEETTFLKEGKKHGTKTKNGLEMLYLQADAAWNIWEKWI